jgi:hypothetical protein
VQRSSNLPTLLNSIYLNRGSDERLLIMRPEIVSMLINIVDENVMVAFIKRQCNTGSDELLTYIELLDAEHKNRWVEMYNKAATLY